jgi:transposase
MQNTELYQNLLGLSDPWTVDRVEINPEDRRVEIWAGHAGGVGWSCPECSTVSPTRDHAAERAWRHLDSCQFETYLHARIPRVACPVHGVRQVHVPWADPDSRFTRQFERLAVGILAECRISGTAAILGLSWDEAQGMQERAVRKSEARRSARLHGNGAKAPALPASPTDRNAVQPAASPVTPVAPDRGSRADRSTRRIPADAAPVRPKGSSPAHPQLQARLHTHNKFRRRG